MPEKKQMLGMPFDAEQVKNPDGSITYDNVYYAQDFADWWEAYFKNGILVKGQAQLSTQLKVSSSNAYIALVSPGGIHVNGRTMLLNEAVELEFDKVGGYMHRGDRVVVEMNLTFGVNKFLLKIVPGVECPSTESVSFPTLVRNDVIYQMCLANVEINTIGQLSISDTRSNESLCGLSQVTIGVPIPEPIPLGTTAANVAYDASASQLEANDVQEAIDGLSESLGNIDKEIKPLKFTNLKVNSSSYSLADNPPSDSFTQLVTIPCAGVEPWMVADVYFSPDTAELGNFSASGNVVDGAVCFYAKNVIPEFTIPAIIVHR